MPQWVKHSVAVMVMNGAQVLAIRRPDNDDELPGIWGLPAGTCQAEETIEDVIRRIGMNKLGVVLTPVRKIVSGMQERTGYRLEMGLWEASMSGALTGSEWQWASFELLRQGAASGSLCCELAIQTKGRVS